MGSFLFFNSIKNILVYCRSFSVVIQTLFILKTEIIKDLYEVDVEILLKANTEKIKISYILS